MRTFIQRWGAEAAAGLLALALRLWLLGHFSASALFTPVAGGHDRTLYHEAARAVAEGRLWPVGSFDFLPLYPWVLGALYAVFGASLQVAAAAGAAGDSLTALLLARLARRLGATPAWAAAAGALYAAYPLAMTYALVTMPNTLNGLLLTGWALAVVGARRDRVWPWAALGLGAGVIALGFAGMLLMAAALLAWWWIRRALPLPAMAAFALGFALPLVPVAVHNTRAEGSFVLLSTHSGFNLYMGNHERATGYPLRVRDFRMSARPMLEDAHRAAEQEVGHALTRAGSSAWWAAEARRFWRAQPGRALALTGRKAVLFWNRAEVDDLRMREQMQVLDGRFTGPLWPGFACFGLLGLLGLARAPRAGETRLLLLAGMTGLVLLFITARYRLTLVPLMGALGAAAMGPWLQDMRTPARRLRALALAAAAAGFVMIPVAIRDQRPVDYHNAAVHLQAAGRWPEALAQAQAGLALDDQNADLWFSVGNAQFHLGHYPGAVDAFRRCLALNPGHATAAYNLALSLGRAGDYCGARSALESAARLRPLPPQAQALLTELTRACPPRAP